MYNEWTLNLKKKTCLTVIVVKLSKIYKFFHQAEIQLLCLLPEMAILIYCKAEYPPIDALLRV
jgi:hypothetical protein